MLPIPLGINIPSFRQYGPSYGLNVAKNVTK